MPIQHAPVMRERLQLSDLTTLQVLRLRPSLFKPVINVLVQRGTGAGGLPQFKIESKGELMALSGCNWHSPTFAEVSVYVNECAKGRGWGRSVLSACTSHLLEQRFQPLYLADSDNRNSLRMVESLGYVDTGAREVLAEGVLR